MGRRPDWNDALFGSRASLYGEHLIKRMGVKKFPINEFDVADFCGYDIKEITLDDSEIGNSQLRKFLDTVSAMLIRSRNQILINKDMAPVRKRTGIFHEIGHENCPWQGGLDMGCSDSCLEPENHKHAEQEAFDCGASIQMPIKLFRPLVMGMPIGETSTRTIASTCNASLEVTAKRYATVSPGIVSVVVAEHVPPPSFQFLSNGSGGTDLFPFFQTFWHGKDSRWISEKTISGNSINAECRYPVRVRYSTNSNGFGSFIPHGTLIPETSPICQTYSTGQSWRGELNASDVGLSSWKLPFMAECFTFGNDENKKVMTFLWRPDKQIPFLRESL